MLIVVFVKKVDPQLTIYFGIKCKYLVMQMETIGQMIGPIEEIPQPS